MDKFSVFFFISYVLAYCAGTDPIDCGGLSSADCKVKFGEQFERLFKEIHIAAINDLYNSFTSVENNIIKELPEDDNLRIKLKESLKILKDNIQTFNANKGNGAKANETIYGMLSATQWPKDTVINERFRKSAAKYKLEDILAERYFKMVRDTIQLYFDLYAGLREIDLKDYPEYGDLYTMLKKFQKDKDDEHKILGFSSFKNYVGEEYNLPYVTAVRHAV